MSVSPVIKNACAGLGEGPHWDEASNSLLYVDIPEGELHKWNSVTGQDEVRHFDKNVSMVIPTSSGGLLIGLGRKLVKVDWESGKVVKEYCEVDQDLPNNRFNDGKCDPSGRLWAGTMANEKNGVVESGKGSLFSLDKDGSLRKHLSDISISNGLAWTADTRIMYYIDSIPRKIYAFDFDINSGTLENQRDLVSFAPGTEGVPDGMTIDTDGKLWVACFLGGKVICIDPETGKELRSVELPAKRITSCCFGGPNYDELYVTSAKYGCSNEEMSRLPLAGSVFKVTGLGVKGTAPTQFADEVAGKLLSDPYRYMSCGRQMSVTVAVKNACRGLGEGPHWEESSQSLLYVDMMIGDVHRWNSLTGQDEVRHFDSTVSLVIPASSGGHLISLGRKLVKIDWESGKVVKEYCEVDQDLPKNGLNDGKCDQAGRLWTGTNGEPREDTIVERGQGSIFSLHKDGSFQKHVSGIDLSNGLAWSADNRIMYYIDTIPRTIYAFDFDIDSGTIANQRAAVTLAPGTEKESGYPDGMAIDTEGKLWVACFFSEKVICFDPETGKEVRSVKLPAKRIASCCFGGPHYEDLYVTTSRHGSPESELSAMPMAGSVFKITGLGVKGTPAAEFAG